MENDNPLITRAEEMIASLDNGPPDRKTAEQVREWIAKASEKIAETDLLRDDLIGRIAGMAKAIAVARHSEERLQKVADMVAELRDLDAAALITAYHKTAARFRDTFRSTFNPRPYKPARSNSRTADVSDYK